MLFHKDDSFSICFDIQGVIGLVHTYIKRFFISYYRVIYSMATILKLSHLRFISHNLNRQRFGVTFDFFEGHNIQNPSEIQKQRTSKCLRMLSHAKRMAK